MREKIIGVTVGTPLNPSEIKKKMNLNSYATEQYVNDYAQPKGEYLTKVPEGYAKTSDIPTKAEDIGALPSTYTPPNQTAEQVGADPKGTAAGAVSQHNTDETAHNDLRLELKRVADRLEEFLDSDDEKLDQLSELIAGIRSNKTLIEAVTTGKVSVTDIIDNLTTNVANKPLSAAQGVVLKGLIDAVSNSLANYQPKGNYLTEETDPTVPAWAKQSTKPSYSKSEVGLGNVDNVKQYSASNPPPYPVTSVNGKTGDVTLDFVPDAVVAEASRVVDTALTHEDSRILRFIAFADAHQKNEGDLSTEITAGTKELGQAVGEVLRQIGVDFVANLGDTTWGSSDSNSATCLEEAKMFNKLVTDSIRGETQIWTEGNHETDKLTDSQIHALIYSQNRGLTQDADHWIEGYGYMDFPNQKVRVICLNTNQGTASGNVSGMSNEQLKWFAEIALDMSGKTDWNVITMGHHPLSYNTVSLMKYAVPIVEAFIEGNSLNLKDNSNTQITNVNFDGKNCQYVGHFHGHAHAYSVVRMQKYTNTYEEIDAWEICIPNACYTRNNQYLNNTDNPYVARYSTPETYSKTNVDGNRTAFNLATVCLDDKIIYADNYGAGIDRVVSYSFEKASYTITRNLTNCTSSSSVLSVVEDTAHTETLTAVDGYTMEGASVKVTMGGVDVTADAYSNGTLNISEVAGNIVITAVAKEIPVEPVVTNLLDVSQRTYVPMTEPQFVENTVTREMDYSKCYAIFKDGRRGSYPTSKLTYTPESDGFTFKLSSTSGYGVEFPVQLEGGKEYRLDVNSKHQERSPAIKLVKYNPDTTVSEITDIQVEMGNGERIVKTITPTTGYLYSISFIATVSTSIKLTDISLMEKS